MDILFSKNIKTLFYIIGLLWTAKKAFTLIRGIYRGFIRPRKNLLKKYGQGSWAFVTGASDGIGKEFCKELARMGFNVILLARNPKKLEDAAAEIKKVNPKIETRICISDLSKSNAPDFLDNINNQVGDLDVSLIINNAGLDHFEKFEKLENQHLKDLIAVNCTAPVLISKNFVPRLRARAGKGGIINVASGAMVQYMAYYSTYSGTKAHVDMFTCSIADEYPDLDVMSLKPFDVSTKMIGYRQPDVMTITPEKCAKGALNDLGYQDGSYGHWMHKI
mmetsp:Transcript_12332/g.10634  ORF Transcript_12332/g.10634 Transcript_12332/m.10634 type:complete len:277 (+) Transcript_12332:54-884(+)